MTEKFKKTICDALDGLTINGQRFYVTHLDVDNLFHIHINLTCEYEEEELKVIWVHCNFCAQRIPLGEICSCRVERKS